MGCRLGVLVCFVLNLLCEGCAPAFISPKGGHPHQHQGRGRRGAWAKRPDARVEWSLRRVRPGPARELLRDAVSAGRRPEAELYSAALKECRYAGAGSEALNVMEQMVEQGVELREADYVAIMESCGASNLTEDALRVFSAIADKTLRSYAAVMRACGRGGHWRRARELFQEMEQEGPEPDELCYASLLDVVRRHEPQTALSVAQHLMTKNVSLTRVGSPAVMRTLTACGRADEAVALWDSLADQHIDSNCLAALVEALAEVGGWRRAMDLVLSSDAANSYHYVTAIRACSKAGEWTSALSLLSAMTRQPRLRPELEAAYRWCLAALAAAGQTQGFWGLLEDLACADLQLTSSSTLLILRALTKGGEHRSIAYFWNHVSSRGLVSFADMDARTLANLRQLFEDVLAELLKAGYLSEADAMAKHLSDLPS